MPIFDAENYFKAKLDNLATLSSGELAAKVEQARDEKIAQLKGLAAAAAQREAEVALAKRSAANSLSGQLGLDSESFLGNAINQVASLASGTTRVAGQLASLPVTAAGMVDTLGATPEDYAAYNQYQQTGVLTPGMNREAIANFQKADQKRQLARSINQATDFSSIVDPVNRAKQTAEMGEGFQAAWDKTTKGWDDATHGKFFEGAKDTISGLATLLVNAGKAAVNHPMASLEYMTENAPQLALGAFGKGGQAMLGASNIGYAADNYQQGLENYAKKNNGQLPPEAERNRMAMLAASLAVAEEAGDLFTLNSAKASKEALKTSFKNSLKNIGKVGAENAVTEAATEGYQTWGEGEVTGKPATPFEIYQGATIGGIAGAGMAAGARTVAELAQATPEHAAERANQAQQADTFSTAVEKNDPSVYLNPDDTNYDPTKAMGVLLQKASHPDTPEDIKKENLSKAEGILHTLEGEYERNLAHVQAALNATDPADTQKVSAIKGVINKIKENWQTDLKDGKVEEAKATIAKLKQQINTGREQLDTLVDTTQRFMTSDEVQSHVDLLNSAVNPTDTAAVTAAQSTADQIINLSMRQRDVITPETATQLADNKDNALSDKQRAYLREFSAARLAENALQDMAGVKQEVLYGSDKNVGISQWRSRLAAAIAAGNQAAADKVITNISNFATDHLNKAKAADLAAKQGWGSQIVKRANSQAWEVLPADKAISNRELFKNGGLTMKSDKLRLAIRAEAEALASAVKEMTAAHVLKFAKSVPVSKQADVQSAPTTNSAPSSESPVLSVREKERERDVKSEDKSSLLPSPSKNPTQVTKSSKADKAQPEKVALKEQATEQETAKQQGAQATPAAAAVTAKTGTVVEKLSKIYKDRSFRELSTTEQEQVQTVIDQLQATLGNEIAAVEFVVQERPESGGTFYPEQKVVAISAHSLTTPAEFMASVEENLLRVVSHELGHVRDMLSNWQSSRQATFLPNGSRYNAVVAAMNTTGPNQALLQKWFGFTMNKQQSVAQNARELYAQIIALYVVKPELANEIFPKAETQQATATTEGLGTATVEGKQSNQVSESIDVKGRTSPLVKPAEAVVAKDQEGWEADVTAAEANIKNPAPVVPQSPSAPVLQSATPPLTSQPSPDGTETSVSKQGVLSTFAQRTAEGVKEVFQKRNLIADYFKQQAGNEDTGTTKPLAAMKDFLSALMNDHGLITQFTGIAHTDLTAAQSKALETFLAKAKAWQSIIEKNLVRPWDAKPDQINYRYKDPMQFLLTTEGKVDTDENVKTAISYAAFMALVDLASGKVLNGPKEINGILGTDAEAHVPLEATNLLADKGTLKGVLINSWGKDAVAALGLKPEGAAFKNLMPELEASMGARVYRLLQDLGVVETTSVTQGQLLPFMKKDITQKDVTGQDIMDRAKAEGRQATAAEIKEANRLNAAADKTKSIQVEFIRLVRDSKFAADPQDKFAKYAPHPVVQEVVEANRGSQSILNKLFSTEAHSIEPTLEAVPYHQKKAGDGKMNVPSTLARILKQKNKSPYMLRTDLWNFVLGQVTPEIAQNIAGVEGVTEQHTHKANRKSIEAKNDGLIRELDNLQQFVNGTLAKSHEDLTEALQKPIFFEFTAWIQQRVGIKTNMVNPQTSKIHRHMLYQKTWESTIDTTNKDGSLDNFRLRVAEGLGVKTDKQSNEKSLAEFKQLFNRHQEDEKKAAKAAKLHAAVKVLQKATTMTGLTAEEQATLAEGVKTGGENFHSLDALMSMAHYANAVEAKQSKFKVQMMAEVDGVTNGPMLSHLLYGAGKTPIGLFGLLNRGGFFEQDNGASQYNIWRGITGHTDLYETTTKSVLKNVQKLLASTDKKQRIDAGMLKTIYAFTGRLEDDKGAINKDGRNIIKTPLTAMVFGASVFSSVDSMASKFVETIYSRIEALVDEKDDTKRKELLANLNKLGVAWKQNMSVQEMMDTEFTDQQVKNLKDSFKWTLGKAVHITMAEDFADFIKQRDSLNRTAQLASVVYTSIYNAMRDELVKELAAKGELAHTVIEDKTVDGEVIKGYTKYLHDLSVEQEAELHKRIAKIAPVMHSAMSKDSGEIDAGLFVGKTERKLSDKEAYTGSAKFATGKSVGFKAYEDVEAGPGVGMAALSTHSFDSMISHYAAKLLEVLNVHDAHGAGLDTIKQAAKNLNQATWNALLKYSPASEIHDTYMNTLRGLAEMIDAGKLPESAMEHLAQGLVEFANKTKGDDKPDPALLLILQATLGKNNAYRADYMKLSAMMQMSYVDQYAMENGNYEVTVADRQVADDLRSQLVIGLSDEDKAVIAKVEKALAPALKAAQSGNKVAETVTAEEEQAPAPVKVVASPITTGKPAVKSDQKLLSMFDHSPVIYAKQVIETLQGIYAGKGFQTHLLDALSKTVGTDLTVRLITPSTADMFMLEPRQDGAIGWYVSKEGKHEIYILNNEFAQSGLTAETLLHELVHGALARTIAQAQDKQAGPAYELVKELEELRQSAEQMVYQRGLTDQFAEATKDVQELVAWGMTNTEFQNRILKDLRVKSKNRANSLLSGMKKFISTVVGLLFNKKSEALDSGMETLVVNVAGLMKKAQASTTKATAAKYDIHANMAVNANGLNDYSTHEIYEALGQQSNNGRTISSAFDTHLKGVLDSIVTTLYGPFGSYKEALMKDRNVSPQAVYAEAIATGKAPYVQEATVAGVAFTAQEAFVFDQVEAVVKAGIEVEGGSTFTTYHELSKLYTEVQQKLKVSDFHVANATSAEIAEAQRVYDFIFGIKLDANGKSDYLARFAAMGVAHEGFNQLLKTATSTAKQDNTGISFNERISRVIQSILDWFAGKWTHTYAGQNADAKLTALIEKLAVNEARRLSSLDRMASMTSLAADALDKVLLGKREAIRDKLESFGKLQFFQNSGSGFVRAAGGLISTYGGHRIKFLMDAFEDFRNTHFEGKQGVMAGLLNEVRGARNSNIVAHFLLRATKVIEGNRKDLIDGTARVVMGSFAENGDMLKESHKAALSQAVLRTDLQALLPHYGTDGITDLIQNRAQLNREIKAWEAKLATLGESSRFRTFWMNAAETLAYKMATGKVTDDHLLMNAGNIARLVGTSRMRQITESEAQAAEKIIDPLVSLLALSYTAEKHMIALREVVTMEQNRADNGNGLDMLLLTHKALQEKAQELLFSDGKALMAKGYTPEIYDPYMNVVVADPIEGAELLKQGYRQGASVGTDAADVSAVGGMRLYTLRDGGLIRRVSGIISTTEGQAKGQKIHNGNLSPRSYTGNLNASQMASIKAQKQAAIDAMFTSRHVDPSRIDKTFLAPLVNANGEVVNYRYLMEESTKDTLLDRDNRPERLLGVLAGNMYDKVASKDQNNRAIGALHHQYQQEFAQKPQAYLKIGPTSSDPELREIYRLLPHATKEEIRRVWDSDTMYVRADLLDMVFGYRKLSASTMFAKEEHERNFVENMLVQIGTHAFGDKAPLRVRQAEEVWQQIVKMTKSNLVVKSLSTLTGNLRSNYSQLLLIGVPPLQILKHHRIAFKGAWDYRNDSAELFSLQHQLETGYIAPGNTKASIEHRILRLQDSLNRNPVKPLIDAGLMPTIVEDVAADDDLYSYKSKFAKKITEFTDKLNPHVTEVGKWLLMTEDTKPFQVMSYATQISDFLARYTLYQHLTTKTKDPLPHENAIQFASDAFINYDIPTHRTMQYLNDMGPIMFSKYYIRIQKMIGNLYKNHPGRIMAMLAMEKWLGNQPTVLDSSVVVRFGNPFSTGAFNYPASLDSIATIHMLTAPFSGVSHAGGQ